MCVFVSQVQVQLSEKTYRNWGRDGFNKFEILFSDWCCEADDHNNSVKMSLVACSMHERCCSLGWGRAGGRGVCQRAACQDQQRILLHTDPSQNDEAPCLENRPRFLWRSERPSCSKSSIHESAIVAWFSSTTLTTQSKPPVGCYPWLHSHDSSSAPIRIPQERRTNSSVDLLSTFGPFWPLFSASTSPLRGQLVDPYPHINVQRWLNRPKVSRQDHPLPHRQPKRDPPVSLLHLTTMPTA